MARLSLLWRGNRHARYLRLPKARVQDPIGKRYWPFYIGRDGCRAPMQWDATPQAGFTSGLPWLPLHPNSIWRNVEAQRKEDHSLWNFYRRLIALRKEIPALRYGMFQPLTFEPKRLLAYLRQTADDTILVALNFGRRPVNFALGGEVRRSNWELLLSNQRLSPAGDGP